MIRISAKTKKSRKELYTRIHQYFGQDGLGLDDIKRPPFCAYFEGGGGFVAVDIADKDGMRIIDIQSREWEYDTKHFLRNL